MITVDVEVFIPRPPDEVFAFLSDFERNPEWQDGMERCTFLTDPPLRVGSRYEQVARFLGREICSVFEVTDLEPGRSVRATTIESTFPITFTRRVDPAEGGSAVSATIEGDASGLFRLAEPLMRRKVQRSIEADYQRLRELLSG